MLFIFIVRGIFPFGSETFLRTDMYHQYAPFFSEFHHKLHHGGSLLYSWDIGLGVNFTSLYAYYLGSYLVLSAADYDNLVPDTENTACYGPHRNSSLPLTENTSLTTNSA